MKSARSLWRLIQEDRLFRWATYASIVVIWFVDRVGRCAPFFCPASP